MSEQKRKRRWARPQEDRSEEKESVKKKADKSQNNLLAVEQKQVQNNADLQSMVIDKLHTQIAGRHVKKRTNKEIIDENQILTLIIKDPDLGPKDLAEMMNNYYGSMMNAEDVISFFRENRINRPNDRKQLLEWIQNYAQKLDEATKGNLELITQLDEEKKAFSKEAGYKSRFLSRLILLTLFEKNPVFNSNNDYEDVMLMGTTLQHYTLLDLGDVVRQVYQAVRLEELSRDGSSKKMVPASELEKAQLRIRELESSLERTGYLLSDLQDEFDEKLEQSKIKEIVEFFSKLNSEKYGFLLDELLALQKGITTLKRQKFDIPPEISGLLILVRKMIQFVQDNHINPMMKLDQVIEIDAMKAETLDYEGDPFIDINVPKKVRVLSPGWIYQDKEIQISRPKVREEK